MVGEEGLNHLCRKKFTIEQWYMCMYIYIICNYHIPILQYLSSVNGGFAFDVSQI